MYRGNKRDFLEKLGVYLKEKYNMREFGSSNDGLTIATSRKIGIGLTIVMANLTDDETYEKQVYDFVNKILKDK